MQNAETVLDVLRERGRRGLPIERIYRQLFNSQLYLYLLAYGRIDSSKGAMTPGPDAETADGMTMAKIERIIGHSPRQDRLSLEERGRRPAGGPSLPRRLRTGAIASLSAHVVVRRGAGADRCRKPTVRARARPTCRPCRERSDGTRDGECCRSAGLPYQRQRGP